MGLCADDLGCYEYHNGHAFSGDDPLIVPGLLNAPASSRGCMSTSGSTPDCPHLTLPVNSERVPPGTLEVPISYADGPKRWIPYAIIEYENVQLATEAWCWTDKGWAGWANKGLHSFDIGPSSSPYSEVSLSLFVRSSPNATGPPRHELLGSIRLNPSAERWRSHQKGIRRRVELDGGVAGIQLGIRWLEHEPLPLEDKSWSVREEYGSGELFHVEKKTAPDRWLGRHYAMKTYTAGSSFPNALDATATGAMSPSDGPPPLESHQPSQRELKDALASALESGYGATVVSQIVTYGVDLNAAILGLAPAHEIHDTEFLSVLSPEIDLTPLEWAVEHGSADLV
ncbi:uncharacterized protein PG986_014729 [Apiospora aurea]|uniref:Uncharacterized protein n=1 Tax=Apiospora aurea TaxID=335848 RepID=A0ABR1PTT6_9PEZI